MQLPADFIRSILTAASLAHQFSVSNTDSDGTRWEAWRTGAGKPSIIVRRNGGKDVTVWESIDAFVVAHMHRIFRDQPDYMELTERAMQGPTASAVNHQIAAYSEGVARQGEQQSIPTPSDPALWGVPDVIVPEADTVAELEREAAQMRARMDRMERENAELLAQRAELWRWLEAINHGGAISTVTQLFKTAASWAELVAQRDELWHALEAPDHVAALAAIKSLQARARMLSELHAVVQMQNRAASPVLGVPSDLAKFYDAPTWPQLVEAQAKHIASLQKRVQYGGSGAPQQVRAG